MLAKLNPSQQNFDVSFPTEITAPKTEYLFEWVDSLKVLQEVQRFRAQQFSEQFGVNFPQQLDQDLYDFGCEHAVLRNKETREIIAYTRLKMFQGHELAQSYSAQEFQVFPQLSHLDNVVEMGRVCVHSRYRSGKALSTLWLNLIPKVLWGMRAKYLIGCVSIRWEGNQSRAYHTHQYLQQLDPARTVDIQPLQAFEPRLNDTILVQDEKIPKLFDVYLEMQAKLSKQAYLDQQFNCLDYFVLLEVKKMARNFMLQQKAG